MTEEHITYLMVEEIEACNVLHLHKIELSRN